MLKEIVVLLSLVQILFALEEKLQIEHRKFGEFDGVDVKYAKLKECQDTICKVFYKFELNDSKLKNINGACATGCNTRIIDGVDQCKTKCDQTDADQLRACLHGCTGIAEEQEKAQLPLEPLIAPAIPLKDRNGKRPLVIIKTYDREGNLINTESNSGDEANKDAKTPSSINNMFSLLNALMNRGEPQSFIPKQQVDSSSSISDNKLVNLPEIEPTSETDKSSLFTPFLKIQSFYDQIFKHISEAIHSGKNNVVYYAQMLENGTIVEKIKDQDDTEAKIRVFNLGDESDENTSEDSDSNESDSRSEERFQKLIGTDDLIDNPMNLKGRPMPLDIIDDEDKFVNYNRFIGHRFLECRPLKFGFKTFCQDANNFFNCLTIRTGLPKWFFISLILLTSFLMIWIGIFILTLLRKMRRYERVIQRNEDYLPLYKDIEFENEKNIDAGPLPMKLKMESI